MLWIRRMVQVLFLIILWFYWLPIEWFTLAALIIGPIYCGWVCPMGLLQDLGVGVRKLLKLKIQLIPKGISRYLRYLRYIILLLVVATSVDFIIQMFSYDPRGNLALLYTRKEIALPMVYSLLAFVVISVIEPRFFCKYLCVEGAKLGSVGVLRLLAIKRNTSTCIQCGKCTRICSMDIDVANTNSIRSHQCIQCYDCTLVCPVENTLTIMNK